uniref:leucine--tRNA ligase n=1 Tax=Lygus hesperus TaxID=30085 RepID=A0A0A9YJ63_LYGHE
MNGQLHLGHGFSLTKSEFASRYQRMKGMQSLWAFGFHATGTPIAACAQKIAKEMELYGNPPQFPEEAFHTTNAPKDVDMIKFKSKRGKTGPAKPQWLIMKSMGVP